MEQNEVGKIKQKAEIRGVTIHIEPNAMSSATVFLAVNGRVIREVGRVQLGDIPGIVSGMLAQGGESYAKSTPSWERASHAINSIRTLFGKGIQ